MTTPNVDSLSKDVEKLIKTLASKKIYYIKASDDRSQLEKAIIDWRTISSSLDIPQCVRDELDAQIQICAKEASGDNPMVKTVITAMRKFSQILKHNVILVPSNNGKTIVRPELDEAMKKFEASLKDDLERDYFQEAEKCLTHELNRAFIVTSWSVVMYRLYKQMEARGFDKLTQPLKEVGVNKTVTELSDFFSIDEAKVIEAAASKTYVPHLIDKHQKEILVENLKVRNRSAHVSTCFSPKASNVLAYVDAVVDSYLSKT
jgi:hypothetical protein